MSQKPRAENFRKQKVISGCKCHREVKQERNEKKSPDAIIKILGITLVHVLFVQLDCSESKNKGVW